MGKQLAEPSKQRNSKGIAMTSNNDAMDAYTQGVWDAVMILNENEDTQYLWTDVYKALQIRKLADDLEDM